MRRLVVLVLAVAALLVSATARAAAGPEGLIRGARVLAPNHVRVTLSRPVENLDPANFRLSESRSPDIAIVVETVEAQPGNRLLLTAGERLDPAGSYRIAVTDPPASRDVKPPPWALLLTVILSSALINNFVFTRYLGLCIFFGVSRRRDTAVGMGFTFTLVMILSACRARGSGSSWPACRRAFRDFRSRSCSRGFSPSRSWAFPGSRS